MKVPGNNHTGDNESLKDLLQKRQDLDRKVESKYSRATAIVYTDIKGSTQFYETYGDIDGRILIEKHNEILFPIISEYNGKIIKSTGDGMLIVFTQPREGVEAAVAMQNRLFEFNKERKKEEQLNVRIAINYGKVLEDEGDIHGLEVSLAAKINSVTEVDQILVSQSVYEKVKSMENIICRPVPGVSIKGVTHPLQLYRVVWNRDELPETAVQNQSAARKKRMEKRNVFVLDITKEEKKIKISGYEKYAGEQKTVRHYEEITIGDDRINKYNADVIELLNQASQKGHVNNHIVEKLKIAGQLLYDEIFSLELKQKLTATNLENMIISIDDNLVNFPWELLHDGKSFLSIRFNMGRLVRTRQKISSTVTREIGFPLKMLILSDPQGNLKSAYREGYSIRDKLENIEDVVDVNIRSSSITSDYFLGEIRNFDIVHYAGHADYNNENPSDSGFLMEDRKVKASDIINMIGTKPLPAMVFSNACKSGHTDIWKVGGNYETEIYGLANAFLLAGVQHYIGTFWDVQDEPSLYFALEFYKELIDGAMVGEALRKARLSLIERYGEGSVIWASYMLYGDPTVRYVELPEVEDMDKTAEETKKENEEAEEEMAVRGNVRSMEEVVAFPPKKQKWILAASFFILVMALITAFYIAGQRKSVPPLQTPAQVNKEPAEADEKKVDQLIASLIKKYKEDQKAGTRKAPDAIKSGPPGIVFLNIKTYGISEADYEYILTGVTSTLKDSKRVRVVEREIMDKLLKELDLSSSQLADPETALRLGRILSARLISTGSITRDENEWQVSLRLIETETTLIKAALARIIETEEKRDVAETLGQEILNKVREAYPLRGKILSFKDDMVVLDIGRNAGAVEGAKLKIMPEGGRATAGTMVIMSVDELSSEAKITSQRGVIQEGFMVEERI